MLQLLLICAFGGSAYAGERFITFNVPKALGTVPLAINSHGDAAGYYYVTSTTSHSFIRHADGTFEKFSPKGAAVSYVFDINKSRVVVGSYYSGDGYVGYLRTPDGKITDLTCEEPLSINDKGAIAGICNGSGFIEDPHGTITIFDPPNSIGTFASAINNNGEIAGVFSDSVKHIDRGFFRDSAGTITVFDPTPGARTGNAVALNDAGTSAGDYFPKGSNIARGFLRTKDGTITTYDTPSTTYDLYPGINFEDSVVGAYYDTNGTYGYLRASDGAIKTFIAPGSDEDTEATGINDKGEIVGFYADTKTHYPAGFILKGLK